MPNCRLAVASPLARFVYLSALSIVAAFLPQSGASQTRAQIDEHRKYCEGLRLAIEQRRSTATYRHGLTNIQSCRVGLVAPALIAEWRRPPEDTISIRLLAKVSGQVRDQRLFDLIKRVAIDPAQSRKLRIATFHTLLAYFDPHTVVIFRQLDHSGLSGSRYVLMGVVDHVDAENGPMPLRPGVRREILQVFSDLGGRDPDSVIRTIASYLAGQLASKK